MLEGFGEHAGQLVWLTFDRDTFDLDRGPVKYLVYPLSEQEAAYERRCHGVFERKVGTHTCWHLPPFDRRVRDPIDWTFWEEFPGHARRGEYLRRDPIGVMYV